MIQSVSPEEVRRATQSVLDGPEFRESFSVWQMLWNEFRKFLGWVSRWALENPDLAKPLIIVLGIVLALILAHIGYTIVKEFTSMRNRAASESQRARSLQALEGVAGNWADAFQLAKAALDAGDLYRALWITHRVLLSALDRMDLLRFARWKTNNDYLRECPADHAAAQTLSEVSAAYERVVYAHSDISHGQAASLLARVEGLVNEAGR